jgi:hypothetical protein
LPGGGNGFCAIAVIPSGKIAAAEQASTAMVSGFFMVVRLAFQRIFRVCFRWSRQVAGSIHIRILHGKLAGGGCPFI